MNSIISVFPFLDQLYPILKVSILSKRKNNWIRYCDKQVRKLHVPLSQLYVIAENDNIVNIPKFCHKGIFVKSWMSWQQFATSKPL